MLNRIGVFINMNYAQHSDQCKPVWEKIMKSMRSYGFFFQKRVFVIMTDKSRDDIAEDVKVLFKIVSLEHEDCLKYIAECYISDFTDCYDMTLPDTNNSIDVELLTSEQLDSMWKSLSFQEI